MIIIATKKMKTTNPKSAPLIIVAISASWPVACFHVMALPPAWGVYVTVDATARQVETLGGKLLRPPEDIPDIGRFCVLQDPQGATLCAIIYRQP